MKKHLILMISAAIIPLLLYACSAEEERALTSTTLEVAQSAIDFKSDAGTRDIAIVTNADHWTARSDKDWCSVAVNESTLTVNVSGYDGKETREAVIKVTADGLAETVNVRQLGSEPAILISQQIFTVEASGSDIAFDVTTNVLVTITLPEWIKEKPAGTRASEMVTTTHNYIVTANPEDSERTGNITVKEVGGELEALVSVTQKGLGEYESGNLEGIKDDIKVPVESGEASSFQGGSNIDKSFDGDMNTIYHSNWNNAGDHYFPITLTYNFAAGSDMDYLIYYPRTSGPNGNFKEVEIRVKSNANTRGTVEWNTVMTKNFGGTNAAVRVNFPKAQIGVTSVQFIVKSGSGDGQGFAACAEMEFYKKNPDAFDPLTLFTDGTCSELKPGLTDEEIENCPYSFYKNIAYYMKQGKYPAEFRIQKYKAWPHPDAQSETHKTSPYSLRDNPTGISVKDGEQLMIFVGDTHGQTVSAVIQNLDVPGGDGFGGTSYPLSEGANKITARNKGLMYILYHTPDYETAQPVKIHIASGQVNGYFDVAKHQASDWNKLLSNAVDKYFDVVGHYAHLTFPTERFRTHTPDGKALIDAYDQIVNSEMELMGLYKYNKLFKNRMYLHVMYTSYMYATSYHTAYNDGTLAELCNVDKLKTSACWGPAHEIGHCNQTRPGLKWLGTTEVTNNIMSEYIQTTIFGQPSRLQTEDMGDGSRNRYSKAWTQIIAAGAPHGNFGSDSDVFCKLVPFWQLELYFGKVLGRTPLQQSDKGGFYPDVYEYIRTHDNLRTAGEQQTEFVYICSLIAKANLLDFFTKWGFLTPVDITVDDYGTGKLTVTQARIDEIRSRVEALGYPKPDVALEYITDNSVELYKDKPGIVAGTATRSGSTFTMTNWKNVAAYEVVDETGKKVCISDGLLAPSGTATFTMKTAWKDGFKVYAVSATGARTAVTF